MYFKILKVIITMNCFIRWLLITYMVYADNIEAEIHSWDPITNECPLWEKKCYPSIKNVSNFNSTKDAADLKLALMNYNYEKIVIILANRSNKQRLAIFQQYTNEFKSDLVFTLERKLSRGNTKELILALMKPTPVFYRDELILAMKSSKRRHYLDIMDIVGILSNEGLKAMREMYHRETNKTIIWDLRATAKLDDECLKFFRKLVNGEKKEGVTVNPILIKEDLQKLFDSGPKPDLKIIENLIFQRNNVHLRKLYRMYYKSEKSKIGKLLSGREYHFKENFRSSLHSLYMITYKREQYLAARLHGSFDGCFSTDHSTLRRLIVGQAEISLKRIKYVYYRIYKHSLADKIRQKTCGFYQKVLLALIEGSPIKAQKKVRFISHSAHPTLEKIHSETIFNKKYPHSNNINEKAIEKGLIKPNAFFRLGNGTSEQKFVLEKVNDYTEEKKIINQGNIEEMFKRFIFETKGTTEQRSSKQTSESKICKERNSVAKNHGLRKSHSKSLKQLMDEDDNIERNFNQMVFKNKKNPDNINYSDIISEKEKINSDKVENELSRFSSKKHDKWSDKEIYSPRKFNKKEEKLNRVQSENNDEKGIFKELYLEKHLVGKNLDTKLEPGQNMYDSTEKLKISRINFNPIVYRKNIGNLVSSKNIIHIEGNIEKDFHQKVFEKERTKDKGIIRGKFKAINNQKNVKNNRQIA